MIKKLIKHDEMEIYYNFLDKYCKIRTRNCQYFILLTNNDETSSLHAKFYRIRQNAKIIYIQLHMLIAPTE